MAARKSKIAEPVARSSKRDIIEALKADINKRYAGKGVMMRGDEYEAPFMVLRRPSGILELDLACGGGLPTGGVSEIIGPESSGKSSLLNLYFRRQQELQGEEAVLGIAMTEQPYDKGHAKFNCGVEIALHAKEVTVFERKNGSLSDEKRASLSRQIGYFEEFEAGTAEVLYEMILDALESGAFDIIGIDSWGALLTEYEDDNALTSGNKPGGSAGINARFATKIASMMTVPRDSRRNYTSIVGINQYRDNIGHSNAMASQMTNMKVSGGWALRHLKLLSIYLEGGALWDKVDGKNVKLGRKVKWTIMKGKAGCSDGATGEFNILYGKGIDILSANLMTAVRQGVAVQKGAWIQLVDSDGKEILKANGRDRLIEELEKDPEVAKVMEEEVLKAAARDSDSLVLNYRPLPD